MPHRLIAVLLAILFAGAIAGCSQPKSDSRYATAVAEIGDVRDIVPATGNLVANGGAEIRATRPGIVGEILVQEGQSVRAGQVLARLVSPTRRAARDEASANVEAAEARLHEARIALRDAEEKLNRSRALHERGFVSAASIRNGEADVERARASMERIDSERQATKARLRLTSAAGQDADIVAPLDGVITLAAVRVGQQVSPDDAHPLFQTGQDIRALVLEVMVAESDLPRVTLDSRVRFSVDAYPGVQEDATLVSIGSAPIREGRFVSYRALATVNNWTETLKPGMSASVQLVRADARNTLRIPVRATYFMPADYLSPIPPDVLEQLRREHHGDMHAVRVSARGREFRRLIQEGLRVVFVLDNGEPVRREIRVGAETDDFVEVVEGLETGAVVITGLAGERSADSG